MKFKKGTKVEPTQKYMVIKSIVKSIRLEELLILKG